MVSFAKSTKQKLTEENSVLGAMPRGFISSEVSVCVLSNNGLGKKSVTSSLFRKKTHRCGRFLLIKWYFLVLNGNIAVKTGYP